MDKLELDVLNEFIKAFSKLGNDVGMIIGATRNLGLDYEDASEKLRKLSQQLKMLSNKNPLLMEKAGFRDRCILVHRDKNGKIIDKRDTGWRTNTLTNAWFANVAGLQLTDVGGESLGYIAIGTGTTAPAPTDTALEYETHREAGTGSRETTTVTNDTAVLTATFSGYAGTEAVTESGAFTAATGGIMACRQTFDPLNINWGAGDSLQVTWKIQTKQAA